MTTAKKAATKKTVAAKTKSAAKHKTAAKKSSIPAPKPKVFTLITGGTGFLGSHLVRQLAEAGERNLRVMASSPAPPSWLAELNVEYVAGSITDAQDVKSALDGVARIYHLAGMVSRDAEEARLMYELHVTGTRLLCEAARESAVETIVLASTSGTIAVTETGEDIPDETWPVPMKIISRWPYYASKAYQEQAALQNFTGDNKRRLVIVNPSLLLGPGDERLSSTKIILDFLARKIMAVPSGGLSFVDVRDAAAAFHAAMERGRHGERYLLGAANWTFEKFFGRLERISKVSAPRIALPSKLTVRSAHAVGALFRHWNWSPPVEPLEIEMAEHFWYLDSSKAERELSFAPRDPAETLQDTIAYVRQNFLGQSAFA
jgi:dihydroflavonol-4-reductase